MGVLLLFACGFRCACFEAEAVISGFQDVVNAALNFPRSAEVKFPTFLGAGDEPALVIGSLRAWFRRSAATLGWRRRRNGRVCSDVFGDEIGMGAQPVACAGNLDHDSVVQETIEQRGGDDGIAEDFSPFRKSAIGRQDHSPLLITGVDQLEEEVGPSGCDGQISDLIDEALML